MRRVTLTMDEASFLALNCAAHELCLSRSDVVRRLVNLACAAVVMGQGDVPADADDETMKRAAEAGCEQAGLFTLGGPFADRAGTLFAGRLPTALRVIRGGADDDEAIALLDPEPGGGDA